MSASDRWTPPTATISVLGDKRSEAYKSILCELATTLHRVELQGPVPDGVVILVTRRPAQWKARLTNYLSRTIVVDTGSAWPGDPDFPTVLGWPVEWSRLTREVDKLVLNSERSRREFDELAAPNLVGHAPAFLEACDLIRLFAPSDLPILVEGETGTGKELAARALHYLSPRCDAPLVPVNCGALPEMLFENELFGHLAGAFTDARNGSEGLIAQAEGGTLFLDEVEALLPKTQVSLLRFLQAYEYRPLGGGDLKQANLRVVAASNERLLEQVEKGNFRRDLYYRLAVGHLVMPPLRERPGDPSLLANAILKRINSRNAGPDVEFDDKILAWIDEHDWPGNVRELINFVERTVILGGAHPRAPQRCTTVSNQPFRTGFREAKAAAVAEFEQKYLREAMLRSHGNVSEAARRAGKDRRAFGRLLEKHGIDRREFR